MSKKKKIGKIRQNHADLESSYTIFRLSDDVSICNSPTQTRKSFGDSVIRYDKDFHTMVVI